MRKNITCLIISLGLAAILWLFAHSPLLQTLDLKLYDLQMNLRTPPKQDPRILFVEMDAAAIDQLGRWPWPRNIFARVTDTLNSLGAEQILFDVTFAEPNQVFIQKEAVGHIFQGQEAIEAYLADEIGAIKGQQTVPSETAQWTLTQVRDGFTEFTTAAQQKLQNALIDNDQILAEAFHNSKTFIGYSFEVVTEEQDRRKESRYQHLRDGIRRWADDNPGSPFSALLPALRSDPLLSPPEVHRLFLHAQIASLIERDLEIPLTQAAQQLNMEPDRLAADFNTVKEDLASDRITAALERAPNATYANLIQELKIFDPQTQIVFQEAWPKTRNRFKATTKFSRAVETPQKFFTALSMESPLDIFTDAVQGGGFLNGIPDQDGVLRWVPLFIEYRQRLFPHLALASAIDFYRPEKISFDTGQACILHKAKVDGRVRDITIPIDTHGAALINWAGRWKDTYRHVSIAEIYRLYYLRTALAEAAPGDEITATLQNDVQSLTEDLKKHVEGSFCIIGLTAPGTHDFNPIPYESAYPMVGTHGNVLNAILTGQFLRPAPRAFNAAALLALAFVIGLALAHLSSLRGLAFTAALLTGIFGASLFGFNQGYWYPAGIPLLLSLFSYLGITAYRFSTEEKSKRALKNAFSKYVSPDIIEEIIQDPAKLKLGGQRRSLSVLFSDIRGFTTYSEKRSPEEVVAILNEYLDAMTKVIVGHKGTLDKYVGDEIMAVFGAPRFEPPEVNARRAVVCAVHMLERLAELRDKWRQEGREALDIGIGINTGDMVVGNIGSELRMDYTVIGDAVNLGARVEALTRDFNAHLIISETTYQYVKDIVEAQPLQAIKVKGKEIAVMVYKINGLKDGVTATSAVENLI